MLNIPLRPEGFETIRKEVVQSTGIDSKWDKVYERSHTFVDSVTLHNTSSQTLYISTKENPSESDYDDLSAFSYINIEANIGALYTKRTVDPPVGQPKPVMVLLVTYYTPKQMEEFFELQSKTILSILGQISSPAAVAASKIQSAPVKVLTLTPSTGGDSNSSNVETKTPTFPKPSGFFGSLFEVIDKVLGGGG